jgi:hypothetical protein
MSVIRKFLKLISPSEWKMTNLSKTESINVLSIIFFWITISAIVNPLGDFPLNDDWVYGRAVQSIFEKGGFTLAGGNTSANLIAQSFWGALFCLPFGFSFTALRISTLTMGLIGVLASYGLLREVGVSQRISLLGSLLIALNPIYFGLSNTFMTDVPFFALAIISFYFLVRGLKYNRKTEVIIGILFSYLSLLIRQNGIIILVAFGCAYLAKKSLRKANIIIAFVPTFLGIFLQFIYQSWLELTGRMSPNFNLQARGFSEAIFSGSIVGIIDNSFIALIYIGLFTFPLVILVFAKKLNALHSPTRKIVLIIISTLLTLISIISIRRYGIMPLRGNILVHFGLGPLTLHDTSILNINNPSNSIIMNLVWLVLTIIGIFSALLLIYCLFFTILNGFIRLEKTKSIEQDSVTNENWLKILIILSIFLYFLPMGILFYFDRYLLILIPLAMIVTVVSNSQSNQFYSYANPKTILVILSILLIYGGFSIAATHDYLAWNRVRWQALNSLLNDEKILPNYIDGGYEFNAWYLYDSKNTYAINFQADPKKPGKSWWYVDEDDYLITFGSVNNYEQLEKYSTGRWLPFGPENIFVLRKRNSDR